MGVIDVDPMNDFALSCVQLHGGRPLGPGEEEGGGADGDSQPALVPMTAAVKRPVTLLRYVLLFMRFDSVRLDSLHIAGVFPGLRGGGGDGGVRQYTAGRRRRLHLAMHHPAGRPPTSRGLLHNRPR